MDEQRWQPARAGIVNVWRYDEEVFEFHRGRLLFRGPNGSGKSMALELLFPFMLDANATPARLSSGAKSRGGLLERLLTGSTQPNRAGFLWAEFTRAGESFTIGVRLRASEATRKVTSDWFTTRLREGTTLHLLDENRTPLTRARLEECLGNDGKVYDSADAYREAVRTTLFAGFGRAQYDAMLNALLALRREKISQDLSPDRLSKILSDALPPLDEHEITEVAEGYEKLDRRQENLERLAQDVALVAKLAARQRSYARIIVGAASDDVRAAESQRDLVTRREREAKKELGEAESRRRSLDTETATLEARIRDGEAETEALRTREAFKTGGALEPLRQELARQRRVREGFDQEVRERGEELDAMAWGRDQAEMNLATCRASETRARQDLDARASLVGADAVVGEASATATEEGESLVEAWLHSREAQIAAVRTAVRALLDRIADRKRMEDQVDSDQLALDRAQQALTAAEQAVDDAWARYHEDVAAWVASCEELSLEPPLPEEPLALSTLARSNAERMRTEIAISRATHVEQAGGIRQQVEDLHREREALTSGHIAEPEGPAWRTPRDRPGAPLWRLVDFVEGCDPAIRDGVESALVASGLLDAWVSVDGTLALPEGLADVAVDAHRDPVDGESLTAVLVALGDVAVPSEVTAQILRGVALTRGEPTESTSISIAIDGSFRMGSLAGRGPAAAASFVGAAAQERRRAERVAAIDRELETLALELGRLAQLVAEIDRRVARLGAELERVPTGDAITVATQRVGVATALVGQAGARAHESRRKYDDASAAARSAQAHLMRLGIDHALPTGEAELDEYGRAVADLRRHVGVWSRRRREVDAASDALRKAEDSVVVAADKQTRSADRLAEAIRTERDLEIKLRTLDAHVGTEYRDIVGRLEQLAAERKELDRRRTDVSADARDLAKRIGKLERDVETAESNRREADEHRVRQHARFVSVVSEGMVGDAALDLELGRLDGVRSVLDAARSVAQTIGEAAVNERARDSALSKLNEALHETKQSLAGRVDFTLEQSERGWWLLRAATDGLRRTIRQLHLGLQDELTASREELRDSEQRLFDETLTGTVRQAVADRIRRCTDLVARINVQLDAVRTAAAGVQVRLRWEVDPEQPEAVRSARALLLRDPAALTESERAALYSFFRARLDQVRAGLDGSAGWDTRLREALDYRAWHRFVVDVGHRDWVGFVPATTARIQRLSTGERSMALHLPMLASITAHYGGAGTSNCPRLILLDELFAGVDTANRGQLFGMLVTWDLDAVLTSDHEWCAYATLDGIAIHFLHPAHGTDPVTSTRFVWDGHQRKPASVS